MNAIIKNHKQHLISVIIGILVGLIFGYWMLHNVRFDSAQTIQNDLLEMGFHIHIDTATTAYHNISFITLLTFSCVFAGIFSSITIWWNWIRKQNAIIKILNILFFAFLFILFAIIGLITFIPLTIYDVYCITRK